MLLQCEEVCALSINITWASGQPLNAHIKPLAWRQDAFLQIDQEAPSSWNLLCQFKSFLFLLVSWWPAMHKFGEKKDTTLLQRAIVQELTISKGVFSCSALFRTYNSLGTLMQELCPFWASPEGHPLDSTQQDSVIDLDILAAGQEATPRLSQSCRVDSTSHCLQILWEDLETCRGICCNFVKTVVLSFRVNLV